MECVKKISLLLKNLQIMVQYFQEFDEPDTYYFKKTLNVEVIQLCRHEKQDVWRCFYWQEMPREINCEIISETLYEHAKSMFNDYQKKIN